MRESEATGSAESTGRTRRWAFGSAIFDEDAMILSVDGRAVDVERKSLEVLRHLLQHAGKLVTKDQLLEAVWPGRIVTETVLSKSIHKLREALGDDAQAVIVTVHGYGYRLDAPVARLGPASPVSATAAVLGQPAARPAAPAPRRRPALAVGATAAAAVALAAALLWRGSPPVDSSVAVLPFQNLSEDGPTSDYFVDGVHEAVLSHLARVPDLKVISRTSVMEYRTARRNVRDIARALRVAHVVEGSVQRAGGRVRVTAQLIRANDDRHVWAESYDRSTSDVFQIQSDVAQEIASGVRATLTPQVRERMHAPTSDPEAWELYLRGRKLEREREDRFGIAAALTLYEQAAARDPSFALALAHASMAHSSLYWFDVDRTPPRLEVAKSLAEQALRIAPDLPEAKVALADHAYRGFRDYETAHRLLLEAFELRPGDAEIALWLGAIERRRGHFDEAIRHLARARDLDPQRPDTTLAETLYLARRYPAAMDEAQRLAAFGDASVDMYRAGFLLAWKGDLAALAAFEPVAAAHPEIDDGELVYLRYQAHLWTGKHDAAVEVLRRTPGDWLTVVNVTVCPNFRYPKSLLVASALRAKGDRDGARRQYEAAHQAFERAIVEQPDDARLHAQLGVTLAALGRRSEALAATAKALELLPVSRDALVGPAILQQQAEALMLAGETDPALKVLKDLLERPSHLSAHHLRLDPRWAPLRGHPRFEQLIRDHLPQA